MARLPAEEKPEELNMTPMIDVVFQLLIFFMLTMKFSEVEGKLLTTLPREKGTASTPPPPTLELSEIRIVVCADSRRECGGVERHLTDKGAHEIRSIRKDATVCEVVVEQVPIGSVRKSGGAAARETFRTAARKARELRDATPSSRNPEKRAPVILDADSEVPYEHIIGIVDACTAAGILDLEFVGNARFDKYFGGAK
jgi:biopolymer transport protein ExbD